MIDTGVDFGLAPGLNPDTVKFFQASETLFIAKPGSNTPLLAAFGNAEIVGLKWLSLRNLSAAGWQVSFVNHARPTKRYPVCLQRGVSFPA